MTAITITLLHDTLAAITGIREALAEGDDTGALQLAEDLETLLRAAAPEAGRLELAAAEEEHFRALVVRAFEARGTSQVYSAADAVTDWYDRLALHRLERREAQERAQHDQVAALARLLRETNPDFDGPEPAGEQEAA